MDYLIWIWVAILACSVAIEMLSMQMIAVWFTFSSMAAIILNLCGVIWWIQVLVFCLLALVLLLALRKFSLKYLLKNTNQKTNVDSIVGSHHKLLESIEPEKNGSLKINGVVWTAVGKDEKQKIDAQTFVEIVKVDGNKLVVVPAKTTSKTEKGE